MDHMKESEFDVIVSGGGLTGVVCAVQLARSGLRVGLVERRGTLGWEIGRARRVFVDLGRWRGLSPVMGELEERFIHEHAVAGKVLSAPLVEFALDGWVSDVGVRPLFFSLPVRVETHEGAVTGVTVANKSGYMSLKGSVIVETDHHGRLIRDLPNVHVNSQDPPAEHRFAREGKPTHIRSCVLIGVDTDAVQGAAQVTERLAERFQTVGIVVRPTLPGQVQVDLTMIDQAYSERELAFAELLPQVLDEIRQVQGWEKAGVAYIADDEWTGPPITLPRPLDSGALLGHLVGPHDTIPIFESDVTVSSRAGLFLAGPWIDKFVRTSTTEELALLNRVLLGEMVAAAITSRSHATEGR